VTVAGAKLYLPCDLPEMTDTVHTGTTGVFVPKE
jgi:hypothetical protein